MINYHSNSIYDRGYLLELRISNGLFKAKALLVTLDEDACIDIISIPFDDEYRVIAIPDWNLSFFYNPDSPPADYHSIHDNLYITCFSDIFTITVDIIHSLIDSLPFNISDENLADGNNIYAYNDLISFPTKDYFNQQLPF